MPKDPRGSATLNPDTRRRYLYNIEPEDYYAMYHRQDGLCAICGSDNDEVALCVDHNHKTGEFRGLLCTDCNIGIGRLGDDPERVEAAATYLYQRERELT